MKEKGTDDYPGIVFPNRDFQNIKIVSSFNLKEDIKITVRKRHQTLENLDSVLIDRNATDTLREWTPMQQHGTKPQKCPLLHCLVFN